MLTLWPMYEKVLNYASKVQVITVTQRDFQMQTNKFGAIERRLQPNTVIANVGIKFRSKDGQLILKEAIYLLNRNA